MTDLPFDPPAETPAPAAAPGRRVRRTSQDLRDRRRRLLTWALSITLGVLVVNAVVGENGYLQTVRNGQQKTALRAEVARLRIENESLQVARLRLVSDPAALDETARRELDLIKPGETLVILHDAHRPDPDSTVPALK